MLKIDTHAHYLPRDWPNLAEKYGDNRFPVIHHSDDGRSRIYKDGKFFREIWPKTWDPDERIADYARFGVQVQREGWRRFTIPAGSRLRTPGAIDVEAKSLGVRWYTM